MMAQRDSDVERRMWVKGNLGEINNSDRKTVRWGEKKKALSNAETSAQIKPKSKARTQITSHKGCFFFFGTVHSILHRHDPKRTKMISLPMKYSHKVHIPAFHSTLLNYKKVKYGYNGHKNRVTVHSKRPPAL